MNGRTNSTSTGEELIQIPLDPVETFVASAYNGYVELKWDDPVDKYATPEGEVAQDPQQLVSKWAYTAIVKKEGSDPTGPKDGIPVVNSNIRDQYKETPFTDNNVVNNTEYHYAAFAINEDEVNSDGVYQTAIPKAYSLVLAENTWEQINYVANEGIAASVWDIGDTISDNLGTMSIIAFNHNNLVEGGKAAITFADTYFSDYYLFRATEIGGSYALIFKGGLRIYVNGKGEWTSITGSGDEISIEYLEDKVKNTIKKQFPEEKVIQIQKRRKDYKIQFKSRKKITIDFEGNVK